MWPRLTKLLRNEHGAAAAEMALVVPLIVVLMFSTFELGRYSMDVHMAEKAARDGARYAGRQPFLDMPCGGSPTKLSEIRNLVRTGTTASGGTPRMAYWTDPNTIAVTITCPGTGTYNNAGIYTMVSGGARHVTVTATVPYQALFGFNYAGINVVGRSQAAVMGI